MRGSPASFPQSRLTEWWKFLENAESGPTRSYAIRGGERCKREGKKVTGCWYYGSAAIKFASVNHREVKLFVKEKTSLF